MEKKSQRLPEDVIVEILLRLPVKSLVRSRCVCVRWSFLIRDHFFVNLHFKRVTMSHHLKRGFLLHRRLQEPSKYILSLLSYENSLFELYKDIEIPDFVGPSRLVVSETDTHEVHDLEVIGSCNGIICLGNCLTFYTLINPATRERKSLPHPPNSDTSRLLAVGFGFDSKNNDFKLVRIFNHIIHLYSLRRNSWRKLNIDDCLTLNKVCFTTTCGSVCIKGICHWLGEVYTYLPFETNKTFIVISFDLVDEVLRFVPVPIPIKYLEERILEWNGNIGVVGDYFKFGHQSFYHIWRMGKNGAQDCLTKLSSSGPMYKYGFISLGFWEQNEFLFVNCDNGYFTSYNFSTEEFKNHHMQVLGWGGFGALVETLVSIEDHVEAT